jgi:hypothetical protein
MGSPVLNAEFLGRRAPKAGEVCLFQKHARANRLDGQSFGMVEPEDIVSGEWSDWYQLTPLERWHVSGDL